MAHTPGTWIASKNINDYSIYSEQNENKEIAAAYQYSRNIPEEEAKANANLIAAAPELLKALQESIEREMKYRAILMGDTTYFKPPYTKKNVHIQELDIKLNDAISAINKATGNI